MEVIEDIRSNNAAPGSAVLDRADAATTSALHSLRANLQRASQSLSADLYSSDSHFVFELVQNADDNDYVVGVTPTLKITLESGNTLVVASNETGFRENQVRAICRIGTSTKNSSLGYIGEKGIGFKSVFKVADKVFISSGPYKFFFDKLLELGMLTPCWAEDCPGLKDWTQFTLHLSDEIDKEHLEGYLRDVDPTLLMFLRKLRRLDIRLNDASFVVERLDSDSGLIQLDHQNRHTGCSITSKYLPVKGVIKIGATEKKRPGIFDTEVVLVFPLESDGSPKITAQAVHAFLPIRKYGFSFLIQGDFLTLASREDVHSDSPWNMAIRDGLVSIFMEAFKEFQRRPELEVVWYKYIPIKIPESFFKPFADALVLKLRKTAILRSTRDSLHRPSRLLVAKHLDAHGAPLIDEEYFSGHYLASHYDVADEYFTILYELGVRTFSDMDFIESLSRMDQMNAIPVQSVSWHESVSTHLRGLRGTYGSKIVALRMVPLQDGSWVSLNSGDLFFSSEVIDIPHDLGLRLVCRLDPSSSRYLLFGESGVRNADPAAIAQQILNLHRETQPSTDDVLRHAYFLFAHRDQLGHSDLGSLYVLSHSGNLAKASDLYMNHHELGIVPLSDIFPSSSFLHHTFLAPPPHGSSNRWHAWLKDSLGINVSPRIVEGKICSGFLDFLKDHTLDLGEMLRALRDYWPRLRPEMTAAYAQQLGGKISVICEDGRRHRLSSTAAGRTSLRAFTDLHFLPLDDPEAECWNFLQDLGVTMRPDGLLYLKRLRVLTKAKRNDFENIISIYKHLEARFDEHADVLRTAFNEGNLIFVEATSGEEERWLSISDVVWSGPPSMVSKLALKRTYPGLENFFRIHLAIPDSPDDILMKELVAMTGSVISDEDHKRVSHILRDISDIIAQRANDKVPNPPWISELATHRIFPVRLAASKELRLRKLDEKFYIPDNSRLFFDMFGSRLDMLELDKKVSVSAIKSLLDFHQQLHSHYLDVAVSREPSPVSEGVPDVESQEGFLARIPFVERLLRPHRKSKELLGKLGNLVVTRVDALLSTYIIEDLVKSHNDNLTITEEPDRFVICISAGCTPIEQKLQFCKQLAPILGLQLERLSLVICTDPAFAKQYLDGEGLGQRAESDLQDMDDTWASGTILESTSGETTGPFSSVPWSPVDGALEVPTRAGQPSVGAGLPNLATDLIKSGMSTVQEAAARESLSDICASIFLPPIDTQNVTSVGSNLPATSMEGEAMSTNMSYPTSGEHSNAPPFESTPIPREPSIPLTPAEDAHGVLGEYFIYQMFQRILPNFTEENWTSELRGAMPGFPPYSSSSESVADFRYTDIKGTLTTAVFGEAMFQAWTGHWPVYYIEVKTTGDEKLSIPFHMSRRQLQLASRFRPRPDKKPSPVYVLVRVWNIKGRKPSYRIIPDPHHHFYTGGLKIVSNVEAVLRP
ncbi:hypothetical protein DFH06DRAFT_1046179 [Mycena polygramma]|nr:hypothetical protein DFH06DRAFT_1046179 [Mycena polygramma]